MESAVTAHAQYSMDQKVLVLRKMCLKNLKFLCTEILKMKDWEDSLHSDLEKFLGESGKEKLVLLPRGCLKTSIITVGWTIQQVLKNPDVRVLINGAVWNNARAILRQISGYLTDKSVLPQLFGQFKTNNTLWTQDEIEIAHKRTGAIKEPTISTGGVETAKTGMHYDIIINDDLVVRENVTTRDQIEKVINFHRDCYALLDPGGVLIDIGTRWSLHDLYGHIMQSQMKSLNRHEFTSEEDRLEWRRYAPA